MSVRLSRDGRSLKSLLVRVDARCSASPNQIRWVALEFATTRVRRDGRFADGGLVEGNTRVGDTVLNFRASVAGRVGRTRARGTMRLSGTVKDSAGKIVDRCDSGQVDWTLRRGRVYGGVTNQGNPVGFRTSRDRRGLKSFFIDFLVECGSASDIHSRKHLHVAVGRDGRFAKRGALRFEAPQGPTVQGRFSLSGRVRTSKASGTYRVSGAARLPDGTRLNCDSGAIKWTARRG